MRQEIIMAGFGGQGVMVMGQILTYAGMLEGYNVSWMPSYGPEMRGGTANCAVIIAGNSVGAPIVTEPGAAVVMNLPSMEKFEPAVKAKGTLIINSSLISQAAKRSDIAAYRVPINDIAQGLGNIKMINMVALGSLLAATEVLEPGAVVQAFAKKFAAKPQLVDSNAKALQQGYAFVQQLKGN